MATRTYSNETIEVYWDSSRCIHTGVCLDGYRDVFDVAVRPWIRLQGADADHVAATITACPSGALAYRRLDGGQDEAPEIPATIIPWPNGPYFARGDLRVEDRHGEVFAVGPRATLCRCGSSKNQPFCDLSHREVGFRSYPQALSEGRKSAEAPSDIGTRLDVE